MVTQYQYRCFPVPTTIKLGKKDPHGEVVQAYQEIINKGAEGGWEYVGIDTIRSFKKTGCLAAFGGGTAEEVNYKVLIFKKPL